MTDSRGPLRLHPMAVVRDFYVKDVEDWSLNGERKTQT